MYIFEKFISLLVRRLPCWPKGGTLLYPWRTLFEPGELGRPPQVCVPPSYEPRRGVTGFGHFCRNKSGSAAGPKPGNTEHHVDTKLEPPVRYVSSQLVIPMNFPSLLIRCPSPLPDACRLVHGSDALIPGGPCLSPASWPPSAVCVRPILMNQTGRHWFWSFCRNKSGLG